VARAASCRELRAAVGELAAIVRDLPAEPVVEPRAGARHLAIAFLVALLALVMIGIAVAAFR
jgi:hypothetical protein